MAVLTPDEKIADQGEFGGPWKWDLDSTPDWPTVVNKGAGYKAYGRILQRQLRERPAEEAYKNAAFNSIARNVRSAEDASRMGSAQALGINNPSLMPAQIATQARLNAPYGEAILRARTLGREQARQAGKDLLARRQANANFYATVMSPFVSNKGIESEVAIGMAQLQPPGDESLWGPIIGSLGSIGAAAIIASS